MAETLDDFAFTHPLRVRWAELDPQNIVFNANYLMYFDIGLTEYLRALGWRGANGFAAHGTDVFAVNATLDFHAPAGHDDALLIAARIDYLGRSSFRFRMGCFRDGTLLVAGRLTYVNATRDTRRPTPLPEPFIAKILAFERIPPERKPG
ncbi:acyl-CoA thioesterase [Siccirubricoccus phaeus]|uniref:acyl-CoA thioesterase n=1 Tax=Siccirubricoccus phaeus TaxID=2595053 RepID=UPI0011F10A7C|nr:thioesterase family protein [Siccirubricoccus phaeus]